MTAELRSGDPPDAADLLARALCALAASERRSGILGPLAAGEAPWALLVSAYVEQFGAACGAAGMGRAKHDQLAPQQARWKAVLEDWGLIAPSSSGAVFLTERGKGAVEQCLGA